MMGVARITIVACIFVIMGMPCWAQRTLSSAGETVESARLEAIEAVRRSPVPITISAVGFDIREGSEPDRYLQETAAIGGGQYFFATDGGQLAEALGAAASGQAGTLRTTALSITSPRPGDRVAGRVEVTGTGKPGALIVVSTEARKQANDELLRDVPGSRHPIKEDGTWQVWVAAPELPPNVMEPMYYIIKAHWVTPNERSESVEVKVFRRD